MQPGCLPVPGKGSLNAKYAMILPTIGYEESIIGEPVGGINADFFKKVLNLTGISDNEVYFSTVVKCESDDNLESAHIRACKTWLFEELLQLENLKTIYTFGALSTRIILRLKTSFKFSEFVYKKCTCPLEEYDRGFGRVTTVIPLYNPNYVIQRSQKEFDTLVENIVKGK